jgi:hypothetical protein
MTTENTYVLSDDILLQLCAEAILTADGAIDNGYPDLALKQIQDTATKLRALAAKVRDDLNAPSDN